MADDLADHARGTSTFRMMGTGRTGPDSDRAAAVDAVRGVRGLWVADASIFPAMPSADANAAALPAGEKAADLIRSDRR